MALSDVKAGDEVYVVSMEGWSATYNLAIVERTTATQVIVNAKRYRRNDGYEVGVMRVGEMTGADAETMG